MNLLISMLPSIDPQQRLKLPDNRILIRIRPNLKRPGLGILDQPSPATPLNARQLRIHDLLESIQAPICLINGFSELARGRLTSA